MLHSLLSYGTTNSFPPRRGHTATLVGRELLVYGGSSVAELRSDVWLWTGLPNDVPRMLEKASHRIPGRANHTATLLPNASAQGDVLLVYGGGQMRETCVWLLELASAEWHCVTLVRPLPFLAQHSAVLVPGAGDTALTRQSAVRACLERSATAPGHGAAFCVHEALATSSFSYEHDFVAMFGGVNGPFDYSNDLYLLSCDTLAWTRVVAHNAPPPMSCHSAVLVDRRMYVYGGRNADSVFDTLYEFDFALMQWRLVVCTGDAKPGPRAGHGAALVGRGRFMVVMGGWDGSRDDNGREMGALALDAWVLDLRTFVWNCKPVSAMTATYDEDDTACHSSYTVTPDARDMLTVTLAPWADADSQQLIVIGGTNEEFAYLDDAWAVVLSVVPASLQQLSLRQHLRQLAHDANERSLGEWERVAVGEIDCQRKCHFCSRERASMLRCSACKVTRYCSVECQRNDYARHRIGCNFKHGLRYANVAGALEELEKGFALLCVLNLVERVRHELMFDDDRGPKTALSNTKAWLRKRAQ